MERLALPPGEGGSQGDGELALLPGEGERKVMGNRLFLGGERGNMR